MEKIKIQEGKEYTNYDHFGIHLNNYKIIYDNDYNCIYNKKLKAMETVEYFTMPLNNSHKKYKKEYKNIKRDGWGYIYNDENIDFKFWFLSDLSFSKEYIQILQSGNRLGKCHQYSLMFSQKFKPCNIVTGYIDNKNEKILHSWIEKELGEDTMVFDFTKNFIISKADYYNLVDPIIIEQISSDKIKNDSIYFELPCLVDKLYCIFGELIGQDLEKNKSLIKKKQ